MTGLKGICQKASGFMGSLAGVTRGRKEQDRTEEVPSPISTLGDYFSGVNKQTPVNDIVTMLVGNGEFIELFAAEALKQSNLFKSSENSENDAMIKNSAISVVLTGVLTSIKAEYPDSPFLQFLNFKKLLENDFKQILNYLTKEKSEDKQTEFTQNFIAAYEMLEAEKKAVEKKAVEKKVLDTRGKLEGTLADTPTT